ncbi:MAG: polysaccharide deacetylase [Oscillospiraceae bacterium]|nr:polysaccharide deacetylase [Oscillospiraceae bacterium]
MYLGSVKFFKNLITLVIVLLIAALIAYVVILSIENGKLKQELELFGSREIENVANRGNSEDTSDSDNSGIEDGTIEGNRGETTAEVVPTEPLSPHAHLFPELYAVNFEEANAADTAEYADDSRYIYLSFDDGPSVNTNTILNYLRDYGVKATFFVIPDESELSVSLMGRIVREGHAIGVHSYSHDYEEIYASVEAYLEDFNKARNMIFEATGVWSDIFRFPGGSINSYNDEERDEIIAELTRRGFVYFDWNVDSGDSNGASWDTMYRTVRADVAENTANNERSIILFHDSPGATFTTWVIDDLIESFQNNSADYLFGKLGLDVEPLQW